MNSNNAHSNPASTVDHLTISVWVNKTADGLLSRMNKFGLSAESEVDGGVSLAEVAIPLFKRFHFPDYTFGGQDSRIKVLLDSCKDPKSPASVWLHALLGKVDDRISAEDQMGVFCEALSEKLNAPEDAAYRHMKWATLAMRGAQAIRESSDPNEAIDATSRLVGLAFSTFPEKMSINGHSFLMTRNEGYQVKPTSPIFYWRRMKEHFIDIVRHMDAMKPLPKDMMAFQLLMVDAFDDYQTGDKKLAGQYHGLAPGSMVGHSNFLLALSGDCTWLKDPRCKAILDWHKDHNAPLFDRMKPVLEAHHLHDETPQVVGTSYKPRL